MRIAGIGLACLPVFLLTASGAQAFSRIDLADSVPARVQSFGAYGSSRFKVVTQSVPASFERRLVMPPQAVLRTAVAIPTRVWTTDLTQKIRPTLVRVTWRYGRRTVVLFEKLLDARRKSDQKWFEIGVDLARHAGQKGILSFSARPAGEATGFLVLWDNPEIVSLAPPLPPTVILVIVDALRADRLQPYGYSRPTSRHLDGLSRDGILFENAFASAPKTIPSVPQLLTASYFPDQRPAPSLVELLGKAGLSPARAIVNNPYVASWLEQNNAGLGVLVDGEPNARQIARLALDWLRHNRGVPFLLLLHFLDAHTPYQTPEVFSRRFIDPSYEGPVGLSFNDVSGAWQGRYGPADRKRIADLYDGAIRYVDHHIGRMIEGLKASGIYRSSLIVVTADHGEELWDHGRFFHGQSLYDELIRVPLIIKLPDGQSAGKRVARLARLVDLTPTLVEFIAKAAAQNVPAGPPDGRSLLPLLESEEGPERAVFATVSRGEPNAPPRRAIRTERHKYILTMSTGREEVYDLSRDPTERRDLASVAPGLTESLRSKLQRATAPLSGTGYRIEMSNRSAKTVRYQVRLAAKPAAPFVEVSRVNLEKGDTISVRRHSDGFTLTGNLLPGDRDGTRFDILGGEVSCEIVALADGEPLAARSVRLGRSGRSPESMPALVPIAAPYLEGPAYVSSVGEGEEVELAFWRAEAARGRIFGELSESARERLKALGYVQ